MPNLVKKIPQFLLTVPFLLLVLVLCVGGILAINSATFTNDALRESYISQIRFAVVGFGVLLGMAFIPYSFLCRISPLLYLASIGLLAACFIPHVGVKVSGAYSWIRVAGVGMEPGDLAKLAFILCFAGFLHSREKEIRDFTTILMALVMLIIPFFLLALQPAWGSALVFIGVYHGMLFVSGVRLRYILLPLLIAGVLAYGLYYWVMVKKWDIKIPGLKTAHVVDRIKIFFNPELDPQGKGWQVNQAVIAISSGGPNGKGWRKGPQNIYGYLPKNTSYNDLIFSVIGEEQGFYGGSALIILQGLLLLWCLWVAARARDKLGQLIVVGVVSMLFTHVFVNIGMTMQLVPIIGIPLPFISYGGTFLISCLTAVGLVCSVWVHRKTYEQK